MSTLALFFIMVVFAMVAIVPGYVISTLWTTVLQRRGVSPRSIKMRMLWLFLGVLGSLCALWLVRFIAGIFMGPFSPAVLFFSEGGALVLIGIIVLALLYGLGLLVGMLRKMR